MESMALTVAALVLAPLFPGILLKVKALFAGRKGPPLLIKYFTLMKLCRKGSVYSASAGPVFRLGPVAAIAGSVLLLLFFPMAARPPLLSFHGDVILLLYVMGVMRFFTILAALDTASPFQGMGAAREAFFGTLAEVSLMVVVILFYRMTGALSLAEYFTGEAPIALAGEGGSLLLLVIVALFMVLLTENSRVPVDDPATHLELTMIHEVMILDHSGPDLALIELASMYRLLFYCSLVALVVCPFGSWGAAGIPLFFLLLALIYAAIGVVESVTARLKMNLVPKFILTSGTLVLFAVILTIGFVR